ncbi:MAG: ABC-F family ATP-binding cassette domain-containing protein, partial [Spirochaetales bacterium]|nr:ABC-F family ATP-binding cassette domain-containing protein [Spirochaetales bacterium]
MKTIQLQDISLAFGDRDLLTGVSCTLDTKTKAALAGINGSGKSTLLKIIFGLAEPDSGSVMCAKDLHSAYLPQTGVVLKNRTVFHELESSYYRFTNLLEKKSAIENQLADTASPEKTSEGLLHKLHDIEEILIQSDYYHREARIMHVAKGLGFSPDDMTRSCSEFSGGWQMRIALAKILLESPDLLLLDEPTNYLDLEARIWLRDFLLTYHGGYLLVSHDRHFLDAAAQVVYEIEQGSLKRFSGNYSAYENAKQEEVQKLIASYGQQQAEIARMEEFIERFRSKATKAKQVQSRIKQLEKIQKIKIPPQEKTLAFSFPSPPHSGKDHFYLNEVSKSYGDHNVIKNLDLYIGKGDRLAVTGRNGAGKTTLLRILSGNDTEFRGTVKTGTGVSIGYFAQETESLLHPEMSALEEIEHDAPFSSIPSLRNYLGSFLFRGDDVYKQVSILSGGEKSRLALLKILLHPANVLILDEPTNHLDLASKDMLASAVKAYEGTVIFVSHDADFIQKLANKILYLNEEGAELFEGDYDYFSWKLEQKQLQEQAEYDSLQSSEPIKPGQQSRDYLEQNRIRNRIKQLEKEELELLHTIETFENELKEYNRQLSLPENYTDGDKIRALTSR